MDPKLLITQGVPVEHLKISECIFTDLPVLVSTVLGSCVSVTFFHKKTKTAGIFHAMLPSFNELGKKSLGNNDEPCKFVDTAISSLLFRFKQKGIPFTELELKMFGGAFCITPKTTCSEHMVDVGAKNVDVARLKIMEHDMRFSTEDIQGDHGRKIFFYTETGEVWLKYLKRAELPPQELNAASHVRANI